MSKRITLDGLRDYLTNLKRLFVTKTDAESTYATKAENNAKANNSAVVHKSGDETIADTKTFSEPIVGSVTGSSGSCTGNAATATTAATATNATNSNAANQLQAFVNDDFTSGNHYVKAIRSSQGWSTHLWMCYNNGAKMADEVSVNYANSAGSANTANSATNATYTNWLRTSSHSDHLFHTEWDNAGYFWTYVTAGDGGYRAVRVARSDSSGYADTAANGVDSQGENWIRFKNGIQICWAQVPCLMPSLSTTWTYSTSFSSTPIVTACDSSKAVHPCRAGNIGTTSCLIEMVRANTGGSYINGDAQCIAIGRWK